MILSPRIKESANEVLIACHHLRAVLTDLNVDLKNTIDYSAKTEEEKSELRKFRNEFESLRDNLNSVGGYTHQAENLLKVLNRKSGE